MLNSEAHAALAQIASQPLPASARARIGTDLAKLSRKIGKGCRTGIAELGDDASMSLTQPQAAPGKWNDAVVFAGPFGEIECADGTRLIRALSGIDIGQAAQGDSALWQWMQAAVSGRLARTPFRGVQRIDRGGIAEQGELVCLDLGIHSAQHSFTVSARAGTSSWLQFLATAGWVRDAIDLSALQDVALDARVLLAAHSLPSGAIGLIGPGSVIVPDQPNFTCDGEGLVRIGGMAIQVLFQAPGVLTIQHLEGSVNAEDFDEDGYDEPADGGVDVEAGADGGQEASGLGADVLRDYPVTLDFELGRLQMKLGELAKLGVGVILPVAGGSPSAIDIVAGGKKLGRGEIVDIGGQLGIRVTHWEHR